VKVHDGGGCENTPRLIGMGRILGLFGVKGWVKVFSYTSPRENILRYGRWHLKRSGEWVERPMIDGRRHGKSVIAKLEGVDDREQAAGWIGAEIAVPRSALEPHGEGEYYWSDLEGMEVVTTDDVPLGVVHHLFETGANDVMVVRGERERLVPFVEPEVVRQVDFQTRRVLVDWDPGF
jgi:16S rRNA processing protein RimM